MSELLNVEELFASNVFTVAKMRERLPKKVFQEVIRVMEHGGELSMATADVVAKAMKDWAVEHGATHYTHWFQPLILKDSPLAVLMLSGWRRPFRHSSMFPDYCVLLVF